jgi:hypothetical protein
MLPSIWPLEAQEVASWTKDTALLHNAQPLLPCPALFQRTAAILHMFMAMPLGTTVNLVGDDEWLYKVPNATITAVL